MNIQRTLVLNFAVKIIIPLLFLSLLTLQTTQLALTDEVLNRLDAVAAIKETRIEQTLEEQYAWLDLVTTRALLETRVANYENGAAEEQENIAQTLLIIQTIVNNFDELFVLGSNGTIIASTNPQRTGTYAAEPFFTQGLSSRFVSRTYTSTNGTAVFYVSGPLHVNGSTVGVIVLAVHAPLVQRIAHEDLGLGLTGRTYLFKQENNGTLVFLTNTQFATSNAPLPRSLAALASSVLSSAESASSHVLDDSNRPILTATRRIDSTGWGMIVTIHQDEALQASRTMQTTLIIIMLIALVVTSISTFLVARTIATPISRMNEAIDGVSKGKLDTQIDTRLSHSTDELASLSKSFDRVIISMKLATKRNTTAQAHPDVLFVTDEKDKQREPENAKTVFVARTKTRKKRAKRP